MSAYRNFESALVKENLEMFLANVSTPEWVVHATSFDLNADLEFVELNDLDHMLLAGEFAFPLEGLENDELSAAYLLLERGTFTARQAERLVHLHARKTIRERLGLRALTEREIGAFFAAAPPRIQPHFSPLPNFRAPKCTTEELEPALDFIQDAYPSVVSYLQAARLHNLGRDNPGFHYVGGARLVQSIIRSVVATKVPIDRSDADYILRRIISNE